MKNLVLTILLILPVGLSAQDLVEFENGQVADADEEESNRGMSLALIKAVLTITDEPVWEPMEFLGTVPAPRVGSVMIYDADNFVLGIKAVNSTSSYVGVVDADNNRFYLHNETSAEVVEYFAGTSTLYYLNADCSGQPYAKRGSDWIRGVSSTGFWVIDKTVAQQTMQTYSNRFSGGRTTSSLYQQGDCNSYPEGEVSYKLQPLLRYVFPDEVKAAKYPFRQELR